MSKMMEFYLSRLLCKNAFRGIVVLLAVLLWVGNAAAVELLGGDLTIHGKVIAQAGVHLQDSEFGGPDFEKGDLSMAQTWADLEVFYGASDILSFSAIVRGFKEWAYQLESNAYDDNFRETGEGRLEPTGRYTKSYNKNHPDWGEEVTLREAFVDINLQDYGNLRLGKQQITWGESDGMRLADIINPLNVSRHFNMEAWEDMRIPIGAAYANLTHPALVDLGLDVIFTQDYERDVRGEPGSNTPWGFPIPNAARASFGAPADLMPYFVYDEPADWSGNSEYGARLRYKSPLAGIEFSAFYFHTFNDIPVVVWRGGFLPAPAPVPFIPLPVFYLQYEKYDNFGFTFNAFVPSIKTVLRGEFVFLKDIKFNQMDPTTPMGFSVAETDQYKGMVGFDRQVYIPFLNPYKSFFVSGQYFYLYTDDHENLLDATYMDQGIEEVEQVLSLKINTAYLMEKLAPDILVLVSPDDGWWQVQSSLTYTTSSFHWSHTLGGNFMGGDEFQQFGLMRRNNEVYYKIKYSF